MKKVINGKVRLLEGQPREDYWNVIAFHLVNPQVGKLLANEAVVNATLIVDLPDLDTGICSCTWEQPCQKCSIPNFEGNTSDIGDGS